MAKSTWLLPQVTANVIAAAETGLALAAEHLLSAAVAQTPVDEGTLRASGAATSDGLTAAVSFNTPYAVRQHEELGYHHPRGGKAKYLEDPMHEEAGTMNQIIAAQIRRAAGG